MVMCTSGRPCLIERTAAALKPHLPSDWEIEICYQSRVGPLQWIGPPTEDAITKAAKDGKAILVSPIAFVSEHIETLVELDIDYARVAKENGAKIYARAPALGVEAGYCQGRTIAKGYEPRVAAGSRGQV